MTRRGRAVLALGVGLYAVAWVLGSRALYPVAAGLVFAVVLALAWVRLSLRGPEVHRHVDRRELVEGDDVRVDLVVHHTAPLQPPTVVATEQVGRLGERSIELSPVRRRRRAGSYELRRVPRGRYPLRTVRLSVADPFGLAAGSVEAHEPQAPWSIRGSSSSVGSSPRAARAKRRPPSAPASPAGYELHSVRDHEQGSRCAASTGPRRRGAVG